ncbi:MAG: hypothetical protein QNJ82_13015 [Gammaproteobacteria bacterium]|nr:hypothetical protein [Gammaproteobacteria bacterium]
MTTQISSDLQQLNDTVTRLAETLAASERRYASLASMVRWGAMTLLVLVLAAVYLSSTMMANAFAAAQENWWEKVQKSDARSEPVLGGLNGLLMQLGGTKQIDGMIVKLLQNASNIAWREARNQKCRTNFHDHQGKLVRDLEGEPLQVCFSEAAERDLGTYFRNDDGKFPEPPKDEQGNRIWHPDPKDYPNDEAYKAALGKYMLVAGPYMQKLMEGTLMAGAQSVVDATVLMHRLRRDSDFLRTRLLQTGRIDKVLDSIGFELETMNQAMRLMPTMAAEMNAMNRNMSVMSYSMGSTAGRMGSMLPW